MNWWEKTGLGGKSTGDDANPPDDEMSRRLMQLKSAPRPEFERDLKNRLMQQVAQNAMPPRRAPQITPRRTMLAGLGLTSVLALLAVIVSVAAVGTGGFNVATPTAENVAIMPTTISNGQNTLSSITPGNSNDGSYAPSMLLNVGTQREESLAQATTSLGFPIDVPGYLPEGFKLDSATLILPPAANSGAVPFNLRGYYLNYSQKNPLEKGTPRPPERGAEIDVSGWRVPFSLSNLVNALTTPNTNSDTNISKVTSAARSRQQLVQGTTGVYLYGVRWQVLISPPMPVGIAPGALESNRATIEAAIRENATTPGNRAFVPPGKGKQPPPLEFSRIFPNRGEFNPATDNQYAIEGRQRAPQAPTKTLLWQKGAVLLAVTVPETISDELLLRISESVGLKS